MTTVDEAIARMQAIDEALPTADGLACFNRMYLEVTQGVNDHIQKGFFDDPTFLAHMDVVFANLYFDAVDAASTDPGKLPDAWQPLLERRLTPGIEPIQFALAGMNAHINHDLPVALITTCQELNTAPDIGNHHDDYQKVDQLLDAAEQSVRESFEAGIALKMDQHLHAVVNVLANWSINAARDVAWSTARALWDFHDHPLANSLMMNSLGRTVAMASRCLLIAEP